MEATDHLCLHFHVRLIIQNIYSVYELPRSTYVSDNTKSSIITLDNGYSFLWANLSFKLQFCNLNDICLKAAWRQMLECSLLISFKALGFQSMEFLLLFMWITGSKIQTLIAFRPCNFIINVILGNIFKWRKLCICYV